MALRSLYAVASKGKRFTRLTLLGMTAVVPRLAMLWRKASPS